MDLLELFKSHTEHFPPLPKTEEFVKKLQEQYDDLEKFSVTDLRPKLLLKRMHQFYPGLNSIEKFSAISSIAPAAHIVTQESDPELYSVFQEAYAAHKAYSQIDRDAPRLILMESDLAGGNSTISCSGQQSIMIRSKSLELLNRDELKALMLHEFGHLARDLKSPLFISAPANGAMACITRNAARRQMEYKADQYAVACGMPKVIVRDCLRKTAEATMDLSSAIKEKYALLQANIRSVSPIVAKVVGWALKKTTNTIENQLKTFEHTTSWSERILHAPAYPTIAERFERLQ